MVYTHILKINCAPLTLQLKNIVVTFKSQKLTKSFFWFQHLLQAENRVLTNGFGESSEAASVVVASASASVAVEEAKILEPKEELQYLSEVLGFVVTFTDFPQKSATKSTAASASASTGSKNSPEFITLVKLSTKPPKVSRTNLAWGCTIQTVQYVHYIQTLHIANNLAVL